MTKSSQDTLGTQYKVGSQPTRIILWVVSKQAQAGSHIEVGQKLIMSVPRGGGRGSQDTGEDEGWPGLHPGRKVPNTISLSQFGTFLTYHFC